MPAHAREPAQSSNHLLQQLPVEGTVPSEQQAIVTGRNSNEPEDAPEEPSMLTWHRRRCRSAWCAGGGLSVDSVASIELEPASVPLRHLRFFRF